MFATNMDIYTQKDYEADISKLSLLDQPRIEPWIYNPNDQKNKKPDPKTRPITPDGKVVTKKDEPKKLTPEGKIVTPQDEAKPVTPDGQVLKPQLEDPSSDLILVDQAEDKQMKEVPKAKEKQVVETPSKDKKQIEEVLKPDKKQAVEALTPEQK